MSRFQSILDNVQIGLLLDLCESIVETIPEPGFWIIHNGKLAYRGKSNEVYEFDYAHDDAMSRALVALFNAAPDLARNLKK